MDGQQRAAGVRQWTFMVYLAGDNNLESYGRQDLYEMAAAGSCPEVAVVAQFDAMSNGVTRRYTPAAGADLDAACVAELPDVNTGDPAALLDFITWASRTFPAQRYALVLWNHGSGWKDQDIYQVAQRQGVEDKVTRGQVRGIAAGKSSRALFRSTVERLVAEAAANERAILFDDSSADFLDNLELRQVLQQAAQLLGQPLDLLGLDACLMSMIEVHYQVRDVCRVAVGSQELEPGDGWPYDRVLARLVAEPAMTAEDLGRAIVDAYVEFYRTHHPDLPVTQSAVRLDAVEAAAEALDGLARALMASLSSPRTLGLLFGALRSAQSYSDRDYVDLAHFCRLLADPQVHREVGTAASRVVELLDGSGSPVLAAAHHGPGLDNSGGLSIYMPARHLSPLYARLEFASRHAWGEFLHGFVYPA